MQASAGDEGSGAAAHSAPAPALSAAPRAAASPSDVPCFPSALLRSWFDAAKACDVEVMAHLLSSHPRLVEARGGGIGHTALHWWVHCTFGHWSLLYHSLTPHLYHFLCIRCAALGRTGPQRPPVCTGDRPVTPLLLPPIPASPTCNYPGAQQGATLTPCTGCCPKPARTPTPATPLAVRRCMRQRQMGVAVLPACCCRCLDWTSGRLTKRAGRRHRCAKVGSTGAGDSLAVSVTMVCGCVMCNISNPTSGLRSCDAVRAVHSNTTRCCCSKQLWSQLSRAFLKGRTLM